MTPYHPLAGRIVRREKVTRYLLNLTSPEGRGKARFFMAFGFHPDRPEELIEALLEHGGSQPILDIWDDPWGRHVEVVGPITSPDGRNPTILTAWVQDQDGEIRLATAYPYAK